MTKEANSAPKKAHSMKHSIELTPPPRRVCRELKPSSYNLSLPQQNPMPVDEVLDSMFAVVNM